MPSPSKAGKRAKLRKFVRGAGLAIAILCALGLIALRFVRSSYTNRAVMTQRVQVDSADKLFGDGPTLIGSPQPMIIDDPKAVVGTKDGIRQVDDAYLQSHHIYPLQLKTVDFTITWTRILCLAGLVVGALAFVLLTRRKQPA